MPSIGRAVDCDFARATDEEGELSMTQRRSADAIAPGIRIDTRQILEYWFGDMDDNADIAMKSAKGRRWFATDRRVDDEIRRLFMEQYKTALAVPPDGRELAPRDCLAFIILFDQFSRNMYRDQSAMYKSDALALELCLGALDRSIDRQLSLIERLFLYMPLMHAEDLARQEQMLGLFRALLELARGRSPCNVGFFEKALSRAESHYAVIERFGRFPHRNAILGRASTADEIAFLKQAASAS
jgi:uncharacterized protein (DUF924 family)